MLDDARETPGPERWHARALLLLAAASFPALLVAGWGRWNDVLVDFGRELYVPWRLVQGDVLYRDLAHLNGPLSQYANALVFRGFGAGLATLTVANAVLVAAGAALLWLVARRIGGALAAAATVALFLPVFACGHFAGLGNYNFLAPYAHELTHGVLLALAALATLVGGERPAGRGRLAAAGGMLGLAFLTKPEVFAAAAVAVAAHALLEPVDGRGKLSRLALLAGTGLVAPLVALVALATAMPFGDALRGVLGGWPAVLEGSVGELAFYRRVMGTDDVAGNLRRMLAAFAWTALLLAPAAALDRALPRAGRARAAAAAVAFGATWGFLRMLALDEADWLAAGRQLPLTSALALVACLVALARARDADERRRWAARASFALLALALLAKILLAASFAHYGFALALPAAALLVAAGLDWIPAALRRAGGSGVVFRAAVLALVALTGWSHWRFAEASFTRKTFAVAAGADRFHATPVRGAAVNSALDAIEAQLAPGDTLLVLPEGVMLDYLARRRSPTRFTSFMPPELVLHGEERILDALRATPPSAVLLVHKDTSEYGLPLFGRDYGQALLAWARRRYPRTVPIAGDPPLEPGTSFGVSLLLPAP